MEQDIHVWDAHCHYFSYKDMEKRAQKRGLTIEEMTAKYRSERRRNDKQNIEFELPPKNPVDMGWKWINEMDKYSKDGVIIDKVTLFARDLESLHKAISVSDRLIGFIFLDLEADHAPKQVLKEAVSKYRVKGIKMIPSNVSTHLFSEPFLPIYEFAEQYKLPITIHTGLLIGGGDLHYLNPLDIQPIAREYPEVNFILAHLGGGFVREIMFLFYQTQNVHVDTSSSNIWYKYLPYPNSSLKYVFQKYLKTGGPERLIFGTDSGSFPRGFRNNLLQDQLDILRSLKTSHEDIQKIMRDNFINLLPK